MGKKFDISLKNMTQEIHRLIHQDGLSDLIGGYLLIYSGILSLFNPFPTSELGSILELSCLSFGIALQIFLRRKFVFPRVGIIRPPPINRRARKIILAIMLSIILFCVVSLPIAVISPPFIDTLNAKLDSLDWKLLIYEGSIFIWLMGGMFFIFELFYAIWLKLPRIFFSTFLFLIGMIFGSTGVFMGIPLIYCQIIYLVTGCVLVIIGLHTFRNFLKKYPVLHEGENTIEGGFKMGGAPKDWSTDGRDSDE